MNKLEQEFETWWEREGQEFLYALNTTTDDDIKLVAEVAWKNGAYCAEQAEQEPVAWGWATADGEIVDCICPDQHDIIEGYYTIPLYTQPVLTKDLTDDEIEKAVENIIFDENFDINIARAVIAADREKNK